ncbi:MAG: hypothetical protein MJ102_05240 [Clostridia bacterium]|nr:hypothetical protein [Clostridia bacterium]
MQNYYGKYELAGIPVAVSCRTGFIKRHCAGFETDADPWETFIITAKDVEYERKYADRPDYPDGYLEYLSFYRKYCESAARDGVLLFHSSAIAVDGKAYLFTAPSGTGKSTHTRLWREMLGADAVMVNDDKPLLRVKDGGTIVYGTPWMGKHGLGSNISAPVDGICFIERSKTNSIERIEVGQALPVLLSQTYRPHDPTAMACVLPMVAKMARDIPVWKLRCNISAEAAQLSYTTLTGKELKK